MKKLLLLPLLLALTACETNNRNITNNYALPQELSDCSITYLKSATEYDLTVIRCPNSDTTTMNKQSCGKSCIKTLTTTVIDGVEYVKKDEVLNGTN